MSARDQVAPRRQHLPELDEQRAEILEREAQPHRPRRRRVAPERDRVRERPHGAKPLVAGQELVEPVLERDQTDLGKTQEAHPADCKGLRRRGAGDRSAAGDGHSAALPRFPGASDARKVAGNRRMRQCTGMEERAQSLGEEIANSISHGFGALAALIAAPVLIVTTARHGSAVNIAGACIFAATMVLLYCASTLYHAVPGKRAKAIFRKLDHGAIYPADRRHLHAVHAGGAGRRVGCAAVRPGLEPRRRRRGAEGVRPPVAPARLHGPLPADGLARA